ncbi:MAG TPA: TetR family transcriptional regulator [Jatrophihabitans sp.]|uniref:TetR family transcriptional regulator n=1 Tax=Jatrophihabitans sp. TaxID=1932789 RepID=UPI002DFB9C00|nr:TetR family transcriptional regulator [Jatrophihabitans sp.]
MGRWEPNAQGRLAQAALELYVERGFDRTTVAEIAARAGLTERTFFRYFTDKREVLFGGSGELEAVLVDTVAAAPASGSPIRMVADALAAAGARIGQRREFSQQRQRAISANVDLQERELIKLAAMATSLADALRRRGIDDPVAGLAAETGVAAFKIAFERWITAAEDEGLERVIRETFDQLAAVTAPTARRRSR